MKTIEPQVPGEDRGPLWTGGFLQDFFLRAKRESVLPGLVDHLLLLLSPLASARLAHSEDLGEGIKSYGGIGLAGGVSSAKDSQNGHSGVLAAASGCHVNHLLLYPATH